MRKVKLQKQVKLNLGCGSNKINGYINIDSASQCKPDLILDFRCHALPYKKNSVDEVLLFHTIEHIEKRLHPKIFLEISRVLKSGCKLYVSYPNFWECAKNWRLNINGQRKFWEATLYGRQLYKGDYHVCIMNPDELASLLYECGFKNVISFPESRQEFNTITIAEKSHNGAMPSYESTIVQDMKNMKVREK